MAWIGFIVALALFLHFKRHLSVRHGRAKLTAADEPPCAHDWQRAWADKMQRKIDREQRRWEKHWQKHAARAERYGVHIAAEPVRKAAEIVSAAIAQATNTAAPGSVDQQAQRQTRRQARAEIGFYSHLLSYLGVMALLALINIMSGTHYPWFLWPALGWGIGIFSHYMATFGRRVVRERYFEPAVEREVRREKVVMQNEKQASIDDLSATIAHEIRNPIAAAKSLVQQMGDDPNSLENVEYARVAMDELDRVERRISHLLRYAKEEDYRFDPVNLATIVDAALTQMRSKLDAARVRVARNYIGGPTVQADQEKLKQVFANVLDNAIDALGEVAEERRIELFIENGGRRATVRLRDNGCGIAPDKLERIFNPFFTTKDKGTGLGMAISRKIVEAHEGTIDVVSEPGRGTEFAITIPLPQ
ncbi:MAG: ATP-binding protein [Candidatus Binatia bacterium]